MVRDLLKLSDSFEDEKQISRIQDIIQYRLADDRNQQECRYLMRFWWQFSVSYQEVTLEELENFVSPEKLQIILELLTAIENGSGSIIAWIDKYENISIIEDKGFEINS